MKKKINNKKYIQNEYFIYTCRGLLRLIIQMDKKSELQQILKHKDHEDMVKFIQLLLKFGRVKK